MKNLSFEGWDEWWSLNKFLKFSSRGFGRDRKPRLQDWATSLEQREEPVDQSTLIDGMKQEIPFLRVE